MRNSRFIYLILALGIIPSVAQAADITKGSSIKIGGEVDSQFGIVNQQDAFRKNLADGQYGYMHMLPCSSMFQRERYFYILF